MTDGDLDMILDIVATHIDRFEHLGMSLAQEWSEDEVRGLLAALRAEEESRAELARRYEICDPYDMSVYEGMEN